MSSTNHDKPASAGRTSWVLRRADQAGVALFVVSGLAAMLGYWSWHWAEGDRLIEIDRARPQRAAFRVDVNTADWPELAQLPGIGRTLAQRIVASRANEGPFQDLDDLGRIRGIGPRTLERIRPYLLPLPDHDAVAGS